MVAHDRSCVTKAGGLSSASSWPKKRRGRLSLLREMAEVLEGKERTDLQGDLGNMVVREFIQSRSDNSPLRTVLLCESPHTSKMCHGHASSGNGRQNPDCTVAPHSPSDAGGARGNSPHNTRKT